MKRDNFAFLLGGIVFGVLLGIGAFHTVLNQPELDAPTPIAQTPRGPAAPTAGPGPMQGGGGAAPMIARVRELRQRVEQDPQDLRALVELANLYHDASMFPEAIDFYRRAIEIEPDNPNLLTDLGVCHQGMRDYERALELFAEANRRDPTHWQSLFNIAVVSGFNLGRFDEADRALQAMADAEAPADRVAELRAALDQARSAADDS